jgi:hypothetical protein
MSLYIRSDDTQNYLIDNICFTIACEQEHVACIQGFCQWVCKSQAVLLLVSFVVFTITLSMNCFPSYVVATTSPDGIEALVVVGSALES